MKQQQSIIYDDCVDWRILSFYAVWAGLSHMTALSRCLVWSARLMKASLSYLGLDINCHLGCFSFTPCGLILHMAAHLLGPCHTSSVSTMANGFQWSKSVSCPWHSGTSAIFYWLKKVTDQPKFKRRETRGFLSMRQIACKHRERIYFHRHIYRPSTIIHSLPIHIPYICKMHAT